MKNIPTQDSSPENTTICRDGLFLRVRLPVYTGGMTSSSVPRLSSFESYGFFDEPRQCFVLTAEPPRKWWNLHCSAIRNDGDELYAEVAHINDGQTWVRDADGVTVRLCAYDNKYHYVRNDATGTVFCPSGMPAPQTVENRRVEFHREKTVMRSECEKLEVEQRVFVPRDQPLECTTITVRNRSEEDTEVSVFSYVKFDLGGSDAEGQGVGRDTFAEVYPAWGGVLATNRFPGLPTNRFKGFLFALENFFNANAYRDQFTRADYSPATPNILWGWDCDGRAGAGPDCAGVVQVKLTVPAGGTARADFVLGQAASAEEVADLKSTLSPGLLDRWCGEAAAALAKPANTFQIDVGQPLVNGLFNIFLKKQLDHYLINKSGFRDNLQTDMALALCDSRTAEANLLRALASQYADGSVPHGFRPLNRMQYSDKPAWILQTLPEIIKETGDFDLLEREVPYFESKERGSVWNHALRAMRFLAEDTGRHGLCLQHHADWNDGLEATAGAGERESVFVSMQLCLGAREMAELARRVGDLSAALEAEQIYEDFRQRINEQAWDGEWYVRTLCGDGYRIGSKDCEYGKMYLNTQSWAVLSGVAEGERALDIMRKVDERLETDIGFKICTPPYAEYDPRVGRMSNTLPGANENGGCYNHAAGFKGVADCMLGRAEEAWRTFLKITPDSPWNPVSRSGAEPFSYVNSYSSVPQIYGQSGYAWRTGTAGWMCRLLLEYILGARRHYDGLLIDPCLPSSLEDVRLIRSFRGHRYHIRLRRGDHAGTRVEVDGMSIGENLLRDGNQPVCRVEVSVGSREATREQCNQLHSIRFNPDF
jgi:cellobiose phosphorylase